MEGEINERARRGLPEMEGKSDDIYSAWESE